MMNERLLLMLFFGLYHSTSLACSMTLKHPTFKRNAFGRFISKPSADASADWYNGFREGLRSATAPNEATSSNDFNVHGTTINRLNGKDRQSSLHGAFASGYSKMKNNVNVNLQPIRRKPQRKETKNVLFRHHSSSARHHALDDDNVETSNVAKADVKTYFMKQQPSYACDCSKQQGYAVADISFDNSDNTAGVAYPEIERLGNPSDEDNFNEEDVIAGDTGMQNYDQDSNVQVAEGVSVPLMSEDSIDGQRRNSLHRGRHKGHVDGLEGQDESVAASTAVGQSVNQNAQNRAHVKPANRKDVAYSEIERLGNPSNRDDRGDSGSTEYDQDSNVEVTKGVDSIDGQSIKNLHHGRHKGHVDGLKGKGKSVAASTTEGKSVNHNGQNRAHVKLPSRKEPVSGLRGSSRNMQNCNKLHGADLTGNGRLQKANSLQRGRGNNVGNKVDHYNSGNIRVNNYNRRVKIQNTEFTQTASGRRPIKLNSGSSTLAKNDIKTRPESKNKRVQAENSRVCLKENVNIPNTNFKPKIQSYDDELVRPSNGRVATKNIAHIKTTEEDTMMDPSPNEDTSTICNNNCEATQASKASLVSKLKQSLFSSKNKETFDKIGNGEPLHTCVFVSPPILSPNVQDTGNEIQEEECEQPVGQLICENCAQSYFKTENEDVSDPDLNSDNPQQSIMKTGTSDDELCISNVESLTEFTTDVLKLRNEFLKQDADMLFAIGTLRKSKNKHSRGKIKADKSTHTYCSDENTSSKLPIYESSGVLAEIEKQIKLKNKLNKMKSDTCDIKKCQTCYENILSKIPKYQNSGNLAETAKLIEFLNKIKSNTYDETTTCDTSDDTNETQVCETCDENTLSNIPYDQDCACVLAETEKLIEFINYMKSDTNDEKTCKTCDENTLSEIPKYQDSGMHAETKKLNVFKNIIESYTNDKTTYKTCDENISSKVPNYEDAVLLAEIQKLIEFFNKMKSDTDNETTCETCVDTNDKTTCETCYEKTLTAIPIYQDTVMLAEIQKLIEFLNEMKSGTYDKTTCKICPIHNSPAQNIPPLSDEEKLRMMICNKIKFRSKIQAEINDAILGKGCSENIQTNSPDAACFELVNGSYDLNALQCRSKKLFNKHLDILRKDGAKNLSHNFKQMQGCDLCTLKENRGKINKPSFRNKLKSDENAKYNGEDCDKNGFDSRQPKMHRKLYLNEHDPSSDTTSLTDYFEPSANNQNSSDETNETDTDYTEPSANSENSLDETDQIDVDPEMTKSRSYLKALKSVFDKKRTKSTSYNDELSQTPVYIYKNQPNPQKKYVPVQRFVVSGTKIGETDVVKKRIKLKNQDESEATSSEGSKELITVSPLELRHVKSNKISETVPKYESKSPIKNLNSLQGNTKNISEPVPNYESKAPTENLNSLQENTKKISEPVPKYESKSPTENLNLLQDKTKKISETVPKYESKSPTENLNSEKPMELNPSTSNMQSAHNTQVQEAEAKIHGKLNGNPKKSERTNTVARDKATVPKDLTPHQDPICAKQKHVDQTLYKTKQPVSSHGTMTEGHTSFQQSIHSGNGERRLHTNVKSEAVSHTSSHKRIHSGNGERTLHSNVKSGAVSHTSSQESLHSGKGERRLHSNIKSGSRYPQQTFATPENVKKVPVSCDGPHSGDTSSKLQCPSRAESMAAGSERQCCDQESVDTHSSDPDAILDLEEESRALEAALLSRNKFLVDVKQIAALEKEVELKREMAERDLLKVQAAEENVLENQEKEREARRRVHAFKKHLQRHSNDFVKPVPVG